MASRYLKDLEARRSKIIHVFRNGDPYSRATFIILRLIEQRELERIIRAIEEKVKLPLNRPIRKIFEMSGTLVTSPEQIEDGKYYVAASAENFFQADYGHPTNWVLVGPVKTSKYANVRYTSRREEEGLPQSKMSVSNDVLAAQKSNKQPKQQRASDSKVRNVKALKRKGQVEINKNMATSEHLSTGTFDEMPLESLKSDSGVALVTEQQKDEELHPVATPNIDDVVHNDQNINTLHREDGPEKVHEQSTHEHHQEQPHTLPTEQLHDQPQEHVHEQPHDQPQEHVHEQPHDQPQEHVREQPHQQLQEYTSQSQNEEIAEDLNKEKSTEFPHTIEQASARNTDEQQNNVDETYNTEADSDVQKSENTEKNYDAAATKIQASFRGYQVRSQMDHLKHSAQTLDSHGDITEDNLHPAEGLEETAQRNDNIEAAEPSTEQ